MLRIVQILHNKAHWVFEAIEMPNFPPDPYGNPVVLIDITDQPQVQEGWNYNEETGIFTEPTYVEPEEEIIIPTIEEEILFETKYQTLLLEMGVM